MRPGLFSHVVSLEARTRLSYRVDFWIHAVVAFVTELTLVWFLWSSIFRESGAERIGGYDLSGMMLYYTIVILFAKLVRGPEFQGNISQDIYEGGLNRYLVLPTSYFLFKYAQNVGALLPVVVQTLVFGIAALLVLDATGAWSAGLPGVGMALVSVAVANLLYFAMSFPLQAVAFWADNVWSLMVALRFVTSLLGGAMVPLALFPSWSEPVLRVLPFRLLFDVPVRALTGELTPAEWLASLGLAAAWLVPLGIVCRLVWRRGDLQYSGVGI